ncbi:hypothetical protein FRC07_002742, partial [Ceratobasidium sp. 392]
DLIKRANKSTYPYYDELEQGIAVAKRIADQANETQRKVENRNTVKALEARVEDWKGHHLPHFGELLLDEMFIVTKAEVDREYHVFLFEKIILCCKEVLPVDAKKGGKGAMGKTNSMLRKQQSGAGGVPGTPLMAPGTPGGKKKTPLLLKGRIFLNNVTKTSIVPSGYSLQVWWRGDEDMEYFTLRCRSEEQLTRWQTSINQLIEDNAKRRANERAARQQHHDRTMSTNSVVSYATTLPAYPPPPAYRSGYPDEEQYPVSGRATPLEARRSQPPERERERDPVTPFGDGTASRRGLGLGSGESVRVKVHYKADLFQIIVPRDTVFNDLVTKVAYKVRLCGGNGRDDKDLPLRVKYRDEDGDMISLGSDDDVQMAFDGTRTSSGGVELWVS